MTLSSLLHPKNAAAEISVTELPIVKFVKFVQYENAELLMLVTKFGMVTLVKLEQP